MGNPVQLGAGKTGSDSQALESAVGRRVNSQLAAHLFYEAVLLPFSMNTAGRERPAEREAGGK